MPIIATETDLKKAIPVLNYTDCMKMLYMVVYHVPRYIAGVLMPGKSKEADDVTA